MQKGDERINKKQIGSLMIDIIYSVGIQGKNDREYKNKFDSISTTDKYKIILFNHRKYVPVIHSAHDLDSMYRNKDSNLFLLYYTIEKIIKKENIKMFIVGSDNVYHPEFIKYLKSKYKLYTVLMSTDDPNSSYARTIPYLWVFDCVVCVNFRYHKDIPVKMTDKLLEWGAKKAIHIPYGVEDWNYIPKLNAEDLRNRTVPLLYVGSFYREKASSLIKLKEVFGKNFQIYGNWGLRALGYCFIKGKLLLVKSLSQNRFVSTYQNAKIGINLHLSGELGNARLYQLPANGVMQICDCKSILSDVFDVNKEIVGYDTIEEAIELIKYYLYHEDERIRIAMAGYERAIKNYRHSQIMRDLIENLIKDMDEGAQ